MTESCSFRKPHFGARPSFVLEAHFGLCFHVAWIIHALALVALGLLWHCSFFGAGRFTVSAVADSIATSLLHAGFALMPMGFFPKLEYTTFILISDTQKMLRRKPSCMRIVKCSGRSNVSIKQHIAAHTLTHTQTPTHTLVLECFFSSQMRLHVQLLQLLQSSWCCWSSTMRGSQGHRGGFHFVFFYSAMEWLRVVWRSWFFRA